MIGVEFVCPFALLIWAAIVVVLAIKRHNELKRKNRERVDALIRDLEKIITDYLEDEKGKKSA